METKELKLKTCTELEEDVRELRGKIRELRFAVLTGQSKAVRSLRATKRDLSRTLTVLSQTTHPIV